MKKYCYQDTERWPRIITNVTPIQQEIFSQKTSDSLAQLGWNTVLLDTKSIVSDVKIMQDNFRKYLREGLDIFDTSFLWEYIEQIILAELNPKGDSGKKAKEIIELFKFDSPLKVLDNESYNSNLSALGDDKWITSGGKKSVLILKSLGLLERENPSDVKLQQELNSLIVTGRSGSAMPTPRFLTEKSNLICYYGPNGNPIQDLHDYRSYDAQEYEL